MYHSIKKEFNILKYALLAADLKGPVGIFKYFFPIIIIGSYHYKICVKIMAFHVQGNLVILTQRVNVQF